jgi:hypothetical protein
MVGLVTSDIHCANKLTSVIETINDLNDGATDCAKIPHLSVLPKERVLSGYSRDGVYRRVRQRPSGDLSPIVHEFREGIRAA